MRRSESIAFTTITVFMIVGLVFFIASAADAATIDFRSGGPSTFSDGAAVPGVALLLPSLLAARWRLRS